jgi:hypothetical protein
MARRNPSNQARHDRKVKTLARKYERAGWTVEADISGYDRPDRIGKYIPDILARKRGAEKIIEVETPRTLLTDKRQHEAFRRSAGRKRRRTFDIEEA